MYVSSFECLYGVYVLNMVKEAQTKFRIWPFGPTMKPEYLPVLFTRAPYATIYPKTLKASVL